MESVPVTKWAKEQLPKQLEAVWSKADQLHALIASALDAGVVDEVKGAVERLGQLEPKSMRAAELDAVLAAKSGDNKAARAKFEAVVKKFPNSATSWVNLSRLDELDKQSKPAMEKATKALELAPTHDGVVRWWQALHTRHAPGLVRPQLEKIAKEPDGWRARIALAELLVSSGEGARALELYKSVATDRRESPETLAYLAQSLYERELVPEIVSVLGDEWSAVAKDSQLGQYIVRSFLARHDPDRAEQALGMMGAVEPKFAAELRDAIAKERKSPAAVPAEVRIAPLNGPIWSVALGRPEWLQKKRPASGGTPIAVLAWGVPPDIFDSPGLDGVVSRAAPLALTEALWAKTNAEAVTLLPLMGKQGLVRWTKPQTPEQLMPVFSGLPKNAVLVTGVVALGKSLEAQLTILSPLKQLQRDVRVSGDTVEALLAAAEQGLLETLTKDGLVTAAPAPAELLPAQRSRDYLAALDALAIEVLAGLELINRGEVFNTQLLRQRLGALVQQAGGAISPLLMFAGGLVAAARLQPDAVAAYADDLNAMIRPASVEPLNELLAAAQRKALPNGSWAEGLTKLFPK